MRGSRSHGNGDKKKRGAGQRGGRGMAGTGKRADAKKPSINVKEYFGKKGFDKKGIKEKIIAVNLSYIQENFKKFLNQKIIKKDILDLKEIKANKLLGSGILKEKITIKTKYASKKAIEKSEKNNFKIIIEKEDTKEKESKQKKEDAKE